MFGLRFDNKKHINKVYSAIEARKYEKEND